MRAVRSMLSIALGLGFGLSGACMLDLNGSIACGDGFVDAGAGEECDPAVPSSYQAACQQTPWPLGDAACDPEMCRIINTREQCAICGDGKIDAGEECDGDALGGQLCPDGSAKVSCDDCSLDFSLCPDCGDGELDPGEECDPGVSGELVQPVACTEIESPVTKDFSQGTVTRCLDDCRYDPRGCTFCGDGVLDDQIELGGGVITLAEICDGEQADEDRLGAHCRRECTGSNVGDIVLNCNYECADNCLGFDPVPEEELGCCLPRNELCPSDSSDFPCCWELENPDSPQPACVEMVGDEGPNFYCR